MEMVVIEAEYIVQGHGAKIKAGGDRGRQENRALSWEELCEAG